MLALAARRCEGRKNVQLHEADATSLPVADESFDGAVCVQVLEYVADVPAGLGELYRALRPGGRVVVWDVDWASVSWHSKDPARMTRVWEPGTSTWPTHRCRGYWLRPWGPPLSGRQDEPHPFATARFDPDSYGMAIISAIRNFVTGRRGVTGDEAEAWASELNGLDDRDEFYFACLQCCFLGTRPS